MRGKRIFEGGERKEREREKEREGREIHIKTESNWEEDKDKRTKFGVGDVRGVGRGEALCLVPHGCLGTKDHQSGREAGCIQKAGPQSSVTGLAKESLVLSLAQMQ